MVVGTKGDLNENRAVPAVFAQKLRKKLPNCKFTMETSALKNVESINVLFDRIGREIIQGGYFKYKQVLKAEIDVIRCKHGHPLKLYLPG